ncbi:MAG: hypothetical protein AAF074_19290 [Pseudomonadota bacterium]
MRAREPHIPAGPAVRTEEGGAHQEGLVLLTTNWRSALDEAETEGGGAQDPAFGTLAAEPVIPFAGEEWLF